MTSWLRHIGNVVRGGLIGTVEVVPGVSGGTVALVLGIYEILIKSAGHVLTALRVGVADIPRRRGPVRAVAEIRQADWALVIPVLIGMAAAIVVLAGRVESFVHDYPEHARGLFLGLVAASLFVPITMVGRSWRPSYVLAAAVAAVAAFVLTGLPPTEVDPTPLLIVGAAAVAVSALVLPGLSGSFILLTIGLYAPTLSAVDDRDLGYLAWFALGAVIGLALFVKSMQWLLEHRHDITLAVVTGIIVGCMRALWPWQEADRSMLAPGDNTGAIVALVLAGAVIVAVVLFVARRVHQTDASTESTVGSVQSGS